MAYGAESAIKLSQKLLQLAQIEAESGNYLGGIFTLRSIQKDLEKFMAESQGGNPAVQELHERVVRLQEKFRQDGLASQPREINYDIRRVKSK